MSWVLAAVVLMTGALLWTGYAYAANCTGYVSGSPWQITAAQAGCTIPAGYYTPSSFTIDTGVSVTTQGAVTIEVTGNIDIQGTLSGNGQGSGANSGTGAPGTSYCGAGHGGNGGDGYGPCSGGVTYGSVSQPITLGSGGGGAAVGGAGGGAIKLSLGAGTGSITIAGTVSANGNNGSNSAAGGGSGGSIWIDAPSGTITGSGIVTVNGGNSGAGNPQGGGGGGRVAVYYATNSSTWTLQSFGGAGSGTGTRGGAGTIFQKSATAANGDLTIDNNDAAGNLANTTQATTASQTFDNVIVRKGAKYVVPNTHSLIVAAGGSISGGGTLRPAVIINAGGALRTPGTSLSISNFDLHNFGSLGVIRNLVLAGSNFYGTGAFADGCTSLTVGSGSTYVLSGTSAFTCDTITVLNGGKITHANNSTAKTNVASISAIDIDVQAGGSIDVDGKGYQGKSGVTVAGDESGGGHGGNGGGGGQSAGCAGGTGGGGAPYDSVTAPTELGAGGGSPNLSGFGGGAVKLVVSGTLTVNGDIKATGLTGGGGSYWVGSGAGGAVWISAGTLAGSGTVTANGGDQVSVGDCNAGGGGGRVALYYTTDNSTLITGNKIHAYGGKGDGVGRGQAGGAGSVYLKAASATLGDVIYDNNSQATISTTSVSTQAVTTPQSYDNVTIRNGAKYVIPNGYVFTLPVGSTLTSGGATRPSIAVNSGGTLNIPWPAWSISNLDIANNGQINGVTSLSLPSNSTFTNNGYFSDASAGVPSRIGKITFAAGENYTDGTGLIDSAHGYAYVATYGDSFAPARVAKIRLSDFTEVSSVTLASGDDHLASAVIDATGTYAYFGTWQSPAKVIKVRLSDMVRIGSVTLNAGEGHLTSGVIDPAGAFAYFGTEESSCAVVKINLTTMARVGAVACDPGESNLSSAVIDGTGTFAYFGTNQGPGQIVKINLSTFTRVGSIALGAGENSLQSAVIDKTNGYAYFGTYTTPGHVVKIKLSTFTRLGALDLPAGDDMLLGATIDAAAGFAYFTTDAYGQKIIKVALGSGDNLPTRNSAGLFDPDNDAIYRTAFADPGTGSLYFGSSFAPAELLKYTTGADVTQLSALTVGSGSNYVNSSGLNSFSNAVVTIQSLGTLTQSGLSTTSGIDTLTVQSGGKITHGANSTAKTHIISIAANAVDVQTGGSIDVDGKGYRGKSGITVAGDESGGGHGGNGGNGGNGVGGTPYDSVTQPVELGAGGGSPNFSGYGGGAVKLVVSGTLTVNGDIKATGLTGGSGSYWVGSGAGGAVWISAGALAGSGTVTANGGDQVSVGDFNGGGGGGRVAVYYTTDGSTLITGNKIHAYGGKGDAVNRGHAGGSGSVYLKAASASNGDVIFDNNNQATIAASSVTTQAVTASQSYANVTLRNGARYVIPNGNVLTVPVGGSLITSGTTRPYLGINSGGTFAQPLTTLALNTLDVTNEGTINTVTNLTLANSTYTHNGSFGAVLTDLTCGANGKFVVKTTNTFAPTNLTVQNTGIFSSQIPGTISATNVTVNSGGLMTHEPNTTAKSYVLDLSSTNIDVQAGGSISAVGKGLQAGSGAGAGPTYCGGGHGGNGGNGYSGTGGATYGSVTSPNDLGSGGGANSFGGGLIKLTVAAAGSLTINGTISANGGTGSGGSNGGGSGGTVFIDADAAGVTLAGTTGTVSANGGAGISGGNYHGGGGGGRVAIYYAGALPGFAVTAFGGVGDAVNRGHAGGAGSVYLKSAASANGDVVFDNNNQATIAASSFSTQPAVSLTFDSVAIRNGAKFIVPNGAALYVAAGGTMTGSGSVRPNVTVNSGGTISTPTAGVTGVDVTNNGTLASAAAVIAVENANWTNNAAVTGVTSFSCKGGTCRNAGNFGAGLHDLTVKSGGNFIQASAQPLFSGSDLVIESGGTFTQETTSTIVVGALWVKAGGTLTHCNNSTARSCVIDISATTVTIEAGAVVEGNGLGFDSQNGTGKGADSATAAGGAGYGGDGGNGVSVGVSQNNKGLAYGSATAPTDLGSGGGRDTGSAQAGGAGGGAVKIVATGAMDVSGTIRANGAAPAGADAGGGSGGSVWLAAGTWSGAATGIVTANGGVGSGTDTTGGGCGGGGRIYVTYTSKTFTGTTAVNPGCTSGPRVALAGTMNEYQNAPQVTALTHAPASPLAGVDDVLVSASATYPASVSHIEFYLDSVAPANLKASCDFSPAVSPASCNGQNIGKLTKGSHAVIAKAIGSDLTVAQATDTFTVRSNDPTVANAVGLSRYIAGATGVDLTVTFTLQNTLSGTLTVTLPADFTVTAPAAAGGATSPCLSGFGYTAHTLTATKTACSGTVTLAGAQVTNPPSSGAYAITWVNDDPGGTTVYILGSDQVHVTAEIQGMLAFDVTAPPLATACSAAAAGDYSIALGSLSTSGVTETDHICLLLDTNASQGAVVQAKGAAANPNLYSATVLHQFPTVAGSTTDISSVEGFGMCIAGISTVPVIGGAITGNATNYGSPASCDGSNHVVGGLSSSYLDVASSAAPVDGNGFASVDLRVKARATSVTPAASDYEAFLTFRATATY